LFPVESYQLSLLAAQENCEIFLDGVCHSKEFVFS